MQNYNSQVNSLKQSPREALRNDVSSFVMPRLSPVAKNIPLKKNKKSFRYMNKNENEVFSRKNE